MAPGEYNSMSSWTGDINYVRVYYSRRCVSEGFLGDETRTWREAVEEQLPAPPVVADSHAPFAVSPRSRVRQYAQAAKCRLTTRRDEVRFAERKGFKL